MSSAPKASNWAVLYSYVLPYFAYVLLLSLPESLVPKPAAYALATVASAIALARGRRWYLPLRGPGSPALSVLAGVVAGVAGTALWIALKMPFVEAGGEAKTAAVFWARLVASSSVVPFFEELLFRGLVLLGAVQWDELRRAGAKDPLGDALHDRSVRDVAPGAWTPAAVAVSTLAFAAGHNPATEYPAAIGYGLLMVGLWVVRKDLLSCVVAHGTTNLTLALWVRSTGQWDLW
jgi:membrane protease YdiL (CAAX protease family)